MTETPELLRCLADRIESKECGLVTERERQIIADALRAYTRVPPSPVGVEREELLREVLAALTNIADNHSDSMDGRVPLWRDGDGETLLTLGVCRKARRARELSPAPTSEKEGGKAECPPVDFYKNNDYARGYRDAWAVAHEPASCGHARANWKDPLFGTPEYRGQEQCEVCAMLSPASLIAKGEGK